MTQVQRIQSAPIADSSTRPETSYRSLALPPASPRLEADQTSSAQFAFLARRPETRESIASELSRFRNRLGDAAREKQLSADERETAAKLFKAATGLDPAAERTDNAVHKLQVQAAPVLKKLAFAGLREANVVSSSIEEDRIAFLRGREKERVELIFDRNFMISGAKTKNGSLSFDPPAELKSAVTQLDNTRAILDVVRRKLAFRPDDLTLRTYSGVVTFERKEKQYSVLGSYLFEHTGLAHYPLDTGRTKELIDTRLQARDRAESALRAASTKLGRKDQETVNSLIQHGRCSYRVYCPTFAHLPPAVRREIDSLNICYRELVSAFQDRDRATLIKSEAIELSVRGDHSGQRALLLRDGPTILILDHNGNPERILKGGGSGGRAFTDIDVRSDIARLATGSEEAKKRLESAGRHAVPLLVKTAAEASDSRTRLRCAELLCSMRVDRGGDLLLRALPLSGSRGDAERYGKLLAKLSDSSQASLVICLEDKGAGSFAKECAATALKEARNSKLAPMYRALLESPEAQLRSIGALASADQRLPKADRELLLLSRGEDFRAVEATGALLTYGDEGQRSAAASNVARLLKLHFIDRRLTEVSKEREGDLLQQAEFAITREHALPPAQRNVLKAMIRLASERSFSPLSVRESLVRIGDPKLLSKAASEMLKSDSATLSPSSRARMGELARATQLNLHHLDRFSPEFRSDLLRNREQQKKDARPLAVIVLPKSDHNGAFDNSNGLIRQINATHRVLYYEAGTVGELTSAVREATKDQKASILVLGGHGGQSSLDLGFSESLDSRLKRFDPSREIQRRPRSSETATYLSTIDLPYLQGNKGIAGCVAPQGIIALNSCSTGAGGREPVGAREPNNLANALRRVFPKAEEPGKSIRIFAPMTPFGIRAIEVEKGVPRIRFALPEKVYEARNTGARLSISEDVEAT